MCCRFRDSTFVSCFVLRAYGNIIYGPTAYNFVLLICGNLNPTGNIQWDTQSRLRAGVVCSAETALPITHLSGGVCTNTITLSLSRKQGRKYEKALAWDGGDTHADAVIFRFTVLLNCCFIFGLWLPFFSISPMVSHKTHTYQAYFIIKNPPCQPFFRNIFKKTKYFTLKIFKALYFLKYV